LAPVQQGPKFAAPSGAKAQQRAPSSSTGTAYLNLDASIRAARAEPDKSCLSVELDGGSFTTAFCNESGATAKLLTGSDGDRMPAVVGVPVPAAGLLAHWVDKRSPNERGAALPVGVVVGGSAQAGKVSAPSAGVGKDGNKDGKAGGVEALQVLGGFGRLLGRDSSDPETKLHAFKHNGSSIKLKPRKLHAARARVGILGYDSDDEVDETDGGERVYPGSKLCFELKAATRQGTMHVLPEELLALSLVELKARAATKLGGGDKDKESRVKAAAAAAAGAGANLLAGAGQDVDKEEGEPPCAFDPKAPRAVSLVVPCCWADSERTAASTAAKMVGLEVRLVSSSLATAAGALLGDAGGSGSEPIASFPGLGGGSGGSGGGKGGQKLPAGAVASAVRAALQKTKTQQGKGDVEDTEGGVGAALVLVLNGGHDSIEASLVKVTGLLPGDEGEVGGGALGWVRRLTALKSRGCAHGAAAGIDDVLTAAPTSADAKTVAALAKAAASYEGNGIVSSGGGGKGKGAASGNGGAGAESESSALLQPLRATLLSCVKAVLSAEPSSSVTGAAKPAPKAKLACVVARGALFGGGGASLIGGVMDDLAACLQAASASGSGLFLEAAKAEEVPFFVLPQDAAVKGAAALAAAEGRLPKSPFAQKQKKQEEVAAPAGGGEDNGEEAKDEDGGGGEDEAKGSSGKEDKKKKKKKEKENEVAEKAKKEKAKKSKDKGGKLVACDSLQWALGVAHTEGSSPCASQEETKATKAGKRVPRSAKWSEAVGGGGGGCGKASASSGVVGVDLLFARDSVVPCQASRTYSASTLKEALGLARAHASALTGAKGLCLTVVEQTPNTTTTAATTAGAGGSSSPAEFLRLQPLGNPLVRTNEELEKEKGVTVTLNFEVDASGLLEISSEAFVSEKEEDLAKHSKRSFFQRYMWILFGLLLVASGFGFQLSQVWGEWQREAAVEAGRHTARANALKAYYKDINPAKVGSIDAALDAHKDNYRALWEKLEKKYGKKPPKPDYLGQRKSQNSRKEL